MSSWQQIRGCKEALSRVVIIRVRSPKKPVSAGLSRIPLCRIGRGSTLCEPRCYASGVNGILRIRIVGRKDRSSAEQNAYHPGINPIATNPATGLIFSFFLPRPTFYLSVVHAVAISYNPVTLISMVMKRDDRAAADRGPHSRLRLCSHLEIGWSASPMPSCTQ